MYTKTSISPAQHLIDRLRVFRSHGVHVLGSFIFGLPSDRPETFDATAAAAISADVTFAQFVTLSPYPGTVDFDRWEKGLGDTPPTIAGVPLTRRWLIPQGLRPKLYWDHPVMSAEEIRSRTQAVWDNFYSIGLDLEAFEVHQIQPRTPGVRSDLQDLSSDVRRHRNCHRQRPRFMVGTLGTLAIQTLPAIVRRNPHAGAQSASPEPSPALQERSTAPWLCAACKLFPSSWELQRRYRHSNGPKRPLLLYYC